ncbi:MAG: cytochrome d ubiquinol oxidase subunit II [Formosimonas sp.]
MTFNDFLPIIFMSLMGVSMLIYVILDGYDLGIGLLLPFASPTEKNHMMNSIGPFWDANETWLVLGVGLLLVAFPSAHGVVLSALYAPVALMLLGLILRGVSFDFRIKAHDEHRVLWERLFTLGSWMAALAQGWMLGEYVAGLAGGSLGYYAFAALIALTLPALYVALGAGWLVMKTSGPLQAAAMRWAHRAWWPMVLGLLAVSVATPLVSSEIAHKWLGDIPTALALAPVPLVTAIALAVMWHVSRSPLLVAHGYGWLIFASTCLVCILASVGLAYSLFPYIVMGKITVWQAASSAASLKILLVGAAISLPMIVIYTVWVYRIFWGKVDAT